MCDALPRRQTCFCSVRVWSDAQWSLRGIPTPCALGSPALDQSFTSRASITCIHNTTSPGRDLPFLGGPARRHRVHRFELKNTTWCSELMKNLTEIHSSIDIRPSLLPFSQDPPSRPQATEFADRQAQQSETCRLWSRTSLWYPYAIIHPRGGVDQCLYLGTQLTICI